MILKHYGFPPPWLSPICDNEFMSWFLLRWNPGFWQPVPSYGCRRPCCCPCWQMPGPALGYLVVGVIHDAYMGLGFTCMCGFVVGVRRGRGKIERSRRGWGYLYISSKLHTWTNQEFPEEEEVSRNGRHVSGVDHGGLYTSYQTKLFAFLGKKSFKRCLDEISS